MAKQTLSERRAAVVEEANRRINLMKANEIETEFAAIENGLEIHLRFIPEPMRLKRTRAKQK
jgi:hypothetical protein